MALVKCPECSNEVSDSAQSCPKCGFPITQAENTEAPAESKEVYDKAAEQKKTSKGCLTFLGVIVGIILIIVIVAMCSSGGGGGSSDNSRAFVLAQSAVREQLRAPSTAEFASMRDSTITSTGNTYTVKSYVDAENAFGAKIRTAFTVRVELVSKETYRILSVDIE